MAVATSGPQGPSSSPSSRLSACRRGLGLVALGVLLAGCQVRTAVTVEVGEDGSGTVEVAVGLDSEALAELPDVDNSGGGNAADLTQMVRVEDLRATGWEVGAAEAEDDGFTWVRATKPFGTPEEAATILTELTGPEGPLRDWHVERERAFGRTRFEVSGTADLSAGLEAFGDAGLATALDGEPLGEDVTVIEQRFGRPLGELVTVDLNVKLPGGSESWSPVLGGAPVEVAAKATRYDWPVLALAALALGCGVALTVLLVGRAARVVRTARS